MLLWIIVVIQKQKTSIRKTQIKSIYIIFQTENICLCLIFQLTELFGIYFTEYEINILCLLN